MRFYFYKNDKRNDTFIRTNPDDGKSPDCEIDADNLGQALNKILKQRENKKDNTSNLNDLNLRINVNNIQNGDDIYSLKDLNFDEYKHVEIKDSDLRDLKLNGMKINNVTFKDVNLSYSVFASSILNNVKFIRCNMDEVDFTRAHINDFLLLECRGYNIDFSNSRWTLSLHGEGLEDYARYKDVTEGSIFGLSNWTNIQLDKNYMQAMHACMAITSFGKSNALLKTATASAALLTGDISSKHMTELTKFINKDHNILNMPQENFDSFSHELMKHIATDFSNFTNISEIGVYSFASYMAINYGVKKIKDIHLLTRLLDKEENVDEKMTDITNKVQKLMENKIDTCIKGTDKNLMHQIDELISIIPDVKNHKIEMDNADILILTDKDTANKVLKILTYNSQIKTPFILLSNTKKLPGTPNGLVMFPDNKKNGDLA